MYWLQTKAQTCVKYLLHTKLALKSIWLLLKILKLNPKTVGYTASKCNYTISTA